MNSTRIRLLLICAFLTGILLPAMGRNFYFQHYDIKNGLSQNTVHCILQDRQGFIWFATKDGLNRFDGINFRRVSVDDSDDNGSFIGTLLKIRKGKYGLGHIMAFVSIILRQNAWTGSTHRQKMILE